MKLASVFLTILVAVVLQVTLARYAIGGRVAFDFVLVGVVFAALQWGPIAGILAGTLGGLSQDVLAGEIVGVGGLAKTVVGCLAGVVGTNFVVARPQARMIIVAVSTVAHRLFVLGLYAVIEQRWPGLSPGAMLAEVVINAVSAFFAFHATYSLPGVLTRQRMSRRSSLSRRQW